MDELSADEARRNWRDMLDRVHSGEPIGITRNGKPWAVVMSRDWYRAAVAVAAGLRAFTHDTDGHPLPDESELSVGELIRLIGDAAISELEEQNRG